MKTYTPTWDRGMIRHACMYDTPESQTIVRAVNAHKALLKWARIHAEDLEHASDVPGIAIKCGSQCEKCELEILVAEANGL